MIIFALLLIFLAMPLFFVRGRAGNRSDPYLIQLAWVMIGVAMVIITLVHYGWLP